MTKFVFILCSVQLCLALPALAQSSDSFTIQIADGPPVAITLTALTKLPSSEISAKDKDGNQHVFKGVHLSELLKIHGAPNGATLRGESLTNCVLVKARDGYQVIFSLPEIEPEFTNNTILVAFQMDSKKLPDADGPFRLVVPADKKHARWIRQLTSIHILSYNRR